MGRLSANIETVIEDHKRCQRVFVYGTLKSDYGNNRVITGDGGGFKLNDAQTVEGTFKMYGHGMPFPYATLDNDDGGMIIGEVYRTTLEAFVRCDSLEGYPSFYNRKIIQVITPSGQTCEAWIYFSESEHREETRIMSGNFDDRESVRYPGMNEADEINDEDLEAAGEFFDELSEENDEQELEAGELEEWADDDDGWADDDSEDSVFDFDADSAKEGE